jgi:hypothetical protein
MRTLQEQQTPATLLQHWTCGRRELVLSAQRGVLSEGCGIQVTYVNLLLKAEIHRDDSKTTQQRTNQNYNQLRNVYHSASICMWEGHLQNSDANVHPATYLPYTSNCSRVCLLKL